TLQVCLVAKRHRDQFQRIACKQVVIVEERDHVAGRDLDAGVSRSRGAERRMIANQAIPARIGRAALVEEHWRLGPVVDDDQFPRRVSLRPKAGDRLLQQQGSIVSRDDDRDQHPDYPVAAARVFSATRDQPNSFDTRIQPASPRAVAHCTSFSRRRKPEVTASSDAPSTRNPVTSFTTAEAVPPASPASDGLPQAAASMNTMPKPSLSPLMSRLGIANTSQVFIQRGR